MHDSSEHPQHRQENVIGIRTPSLPGIGLSLLVGGSRKRFAQAGKNLHTCEVQIAEEPNRYLRSPGEAHANGLKALHGRSVNRCGIATGINVTGSYQIK